MNDEYIKNFKVTKNSILAFKKSFDIKNLATKEIIDKSFTQLESNYEDIFFKETTSICSFLSNTVKVLNIFFSLGGFYVLALEKQHYNDVYTALYKPEHDTLILIKNQIDLKLKLIGKKVDLFNQTLTEAYKTWIQIISA